MPLIRAGPSLREYRAYVGRSGGPSRLRLTFVFLRGKTLGGSSSINGATYTRGLAAQYDAWSELLDPQDRNLQWNWDSLFTYMKKVGLAKRVPEYVFQ